MIRAQPAPAREGRPYPLARPEPAPATGPRELPPARLPPRLRARTPSGTSLWVLGEPAVLAQPLVVVTGSRQASSAAWAAARSIGRVLSLAGRTLAAGGSPGIEAAVLAGALAEGGRARVVVVHPYDLHRAVPGATPEAVRRVLAGGGALVSGLPPGHPETRGAYPLRSRIMAGLASELVVVAARRGSGVHGAAAAAAESGVPVRVLAGPAASCGGEGGAELLRDGADPLPHPLDLVGLGGALVPPAVRVLEDAGPLAPDRLSGRLGLGDGAGRVVEDLLAAGWISFLGDGRLVPDYRPLFVPGGGGGPGPTLQTTGSSG